ncbi:MAG: hypothetical protein FWG20_02385 [Candidatus Cloacimonetes bacterium]|nr:hypothetical protein [Candidatus Cloacimonadota bacterium]
MSIKNFILVLLLAFTTLLFAKVKIDSIFEKLGQRIPENKVVTITEFKGNYTEQFTQELLSYLINVKQTEVVDYERHKMVLEQNLLYAEPVFDDKYTDALPSLVSPDIGLFGSANMQKSNFLFKRKEHLDYQINLIELATGVMIYSDNDRIIAKHNPPILLLIVLIVCILALARAIIYMKRGYNVRYVIISAMSLITLIIVWYLV